MRLTKVLRDYASETLEARAREKAEAFSAPYKTEREEVIKECEAIIREAREKVLSVLAEHSFDTYLTGWRSGPAEEKIVSFSGSYVMKEKEEDKIRDYENSLRTTINKTLKDLELECALGANRETFMTFLDSVEL